MALPDTIPVVVSTWSIVDPDPSDAPETPVCETVQLKVVPVTLPVSAIDGAVPEHIVWEAGVVVATGMGFTVTITVTGVPAHPLAVGVTV